MFLRQTLLFQNFWHKRFWIHQIYLQYIKSKRRWQLQNLNNMMYERSLCRFSQVFMVQPILSCNHVGIKNVSYVERNYILKCLLCTSYIDRACFEISRFYQYNGTTYLKKLYIRKQCYWYYIKDLASNNVLILISTNKDTFSSRTIQDKTKACSTLFYGCLYAGTV